MAKNLLQDMFIRKDGQQGKTPVPSVNRFEMLKSTPSQSAAPEPAKESVPIKIYTPPAIKINNNSPARANVFFSFLFIVSLWEIVID